VRAAIWAAVQAVGVTTSTSGDKVYVKLANESAVTSALSSAIAEYGSEELKAASSEWAALLLQDEYHHAWPQWLGGDPNQTLLYLPRVLHNFKTAATDDPAAFHQAFNELFKQQVWTATDNNGDTVVAEVKVNDASSWEEYRKMFAKSQDWVAVLDVVAGLMQQAYDTVLGGATSEAKTCYLAEVDKELAELKSAAVGPS
jgi:hypothetical protein